MPPAGRLSTDPSARRRPSHRSRLSQASTCARDHVPAFAQLEPHTTHVPLPAPGAETQTPGPREWCLQEAPPARRATRWPAPPPPMAARGHTARRRPPRHRWRPSGRRVRTTSPETPGPGSVRHSLPATSHRLSHAFGRDPNASKSQQPHVRRMMPSARNRVNITLKRQSASTTIVLQGRLAFRCTTWKHSHNCSTTRWSPPPRWRGSRRR